MSKLPYVIMVLHETIVDAETSFDLHADPSYVASYHVIIDYYGDITYMVSPEHKAFAAANSSFTNPNTGEIEQINGSVDDFAFHVALETPVDGRDGTLKYHSGYSMEQYNSLAWLIKASGIKQDRIVTHGQIQTPTTTEPRCFNISYLNSILPTKNNGPSINFGPLLQVEPDLSEVI